MNEFECRYFWDIDKEVEIPLYPYILVKGEYADIIINTNGNFEIRVTNK